jgi:hypothetical protein
MGAARYVLAVVSVMLLGGAAGAFVSHRAGSSLVIPVLIALGGVVFGIAAWKWDKLVRASSRAAK